jgi:serine/threonine protein kinase
MKVINCDKKDNQPKVIISEFRALTECECDYIIKMYDAYYREGSINLIIEFMNCGSLEDVIFSFIFS